MKEKTILDIQDLIEYINQKPNNFIYRGHTRSDWKLESSLERALSSQWTKDKIERAESFTLETFKSKFHLYDRSNISPSTKLQWLSLMQHYGVPTRLIDFSQSPYVALYFAIENYDPTNANSLSLYAFDYRNLVKKSLEYIKEKDRSFTMTYEAAMLSPDSIFEEILDRFTYDIVWVTEPSVYNLRLDRQAGCFLLSGNLEKRVQDLIASDLYKDVQMEKVTIGEELYENIFALLNKTNITSKAIYGDLVGLSKSIEMTLRFYHQ